MQDAYAILHPVIPVFVLYSVYEYEKWYAFIDTSSAYLVKFCSDSLTVSRTVVCMARNKTGFLRRHNSFVVSESEHDVKRL